LGISETTRFTARRLKKRRHPNSILNRIWGILLVIGIKKSGNLVIDGINLFSTGYYGSFFSVER
jgi:hypothetical protein